MSFPMPQTPEEWAATLYRDDVIEYRRQRGRSDPSLPNREEITQAIADAMAHVRSACLKMADHERDTAKSKAAREAAYHIRFAIWAWKLPPDDPDQSGDAGDTVPTDTERVQAERDEDAADVFMDEEESRMFHDRIGHDHQGEEL